MKGWARGDRIVMQQEWRSRVWGALPMIVVEDDPSRLVTWVPRGTVGKYPKTPPTREVAATRAERTARSMSSSNPIDLGGGRTRTSWRC